MCSAYLTVSNNLKGFKQQWPLSVKKRNKIGRNKTNNNIIIPDQATSEIPPKNQMTIEFLPDLIQIQYLHDTILEKTTSVKFEKQWKWFDCKCVITESEPKIEEQAITDAEEIQETGELKLEFLTNPKQKNKRKKKVENKSVSKLELKFDIKNNKIILVNIFFFFIFKNLILKKKK